MAKPHVSRTPSARIVGRGFSNAYRADGIEWLPRRAELRMLIETPESSSGWHECSLHVRSGPKGLYRYLPFDCYVYVDSEIESILKVNAPDEKVVAYIRCPAGREFTITVVSEGRSTPNLAGDQRELSIQFHGLQVGEAIAAPTRTRQSLEGSKDFFTQHRVPIVKRLPSPVFVLGAYRSGTSVLTWAIGQHPNIWPLEETNFLGSVCIGALAGYQSSAQALRDFFDVYDVSQQEFLAHQGEMIDTLFRRASERHESHANLAHIAGDVKGHSGRHDSRLTLLRGSYAPKRRWVDGTPENVHFSLPLRMMFPLAKFVCVVRHPADAVASLVHFRRAGGQRYSLDEAVETWKGMNAAALRTALAFGPGVVKVVSYRDLVTEPLPRLRKIFSFLDEPRFAPAAETFEERINSSSISGRELTEVRAFIDAMSPDESPLPLYEELLGLSEERSPDPNAQLQLEESLRDLVHRVSLQIR